MSIENAVLDFLSRSDYVVAFFAVAATLVSGLLSLLSSRARSGGGPARHTSGGIDQDPETSARLTDIRDQRVRHRNISLWNNAAANLLVIGQYIVGGALASSVVQTNLNAAVTGMLGLVVLLSSLISNRFRPDLRASQAKRRLYEIKKLEREIEDLLFASKNGASTALPIGKIRERASQGLADIESREIEDDDSAPFNSNDPKKIAGRKTP